MAREIPEVVRAAAGLAATVLDEARKLPETLPGLPVRLIGLAMQQAMKVQQQYAGLVARGDELFTGLRGENEPGLATFDDEEAPAVPASNGFRESAFDRAGDSFTASTDDADAEVADLPADPAADAVTAVVDELGDKVETGEQSIEELAAEAPAIEEILDEIAIDELVDQAPTLEETAPGLSLVDDSAATEDADAVESALLESDDSPAADTAVETADVSTDVDVVTPDGGIAAVEASVTDEGVAAPEAPAAAPETPAAGDESGSADDAAIAEGATVDAVGETSTAPTDDPQGGSELSGSQAVGAAPVDGYDSFSIAQLRGRLRGYALSTVQDLVAYEEATRARGPYLTLLRNRLEKLEEQAIESSPLAPRGA